MILRITFFSRAADPHITDIAHCPDFLVTRLVTRRGQNEQICDHMGRSSWSAKSSIFRGEITSEHMHQNEAKMPRIHCERRALPTELTPRC